MNSEEIGISIKCEQGEVKRRFRLRAKNYKELYAALVAQFGDGVNLFWKDDDNDEIILDSAEALEEAHSEGAICGELVHVIVKQKPTPVENKATLVQTEPITEKSSINELDQKPIPASGRTEGAVHGALCDVCDAYIIGHRFQCLMCQNYDLCQICESTGAHGNHAMMRIVDPNLTLIPWGAKFCQAGKAFEPKPQQQKGPNSPKTADEKFKEITKNGLQFLAEVGSVVTDTLSNFGIDATYEVRGGRETGGRTTGRKESAGSATASSPTAEVKTESKEKKAEKKQDKKEVAKEDKKEEKKAEQKKEKEAEKVEQKKSEHFNPFASLYPSTGFTPVPLEKQFVKPSETPIITREQAKLNKSAEKMAEDTRKKPTRLEDAVAKAKENKQRGAFSSATTDFGGRREEIGARREQFGLRREDSDFGAFERRIPKDGVSRSRGFGTGYYNESEDPDYRYPPRQTKRALRKREDGLSSTRSDSFGDQIHGSRCPCLACSQRLGFGGRRLDDEPRFGFGSVRSSSFRGNGGFRGDGTFGNYTDGCGFGCCGCSECESPRPRIENAEKFKPDAPGAVYQERGFGRSRLLRPNSSFGKNHEGSAFGEPVYKEDEEALKAKENPYYYRIEKAPSAFVAHYEIKGKDTKEENEPVQEVVLEKAPESKSVPATVLIPLLEEIKLATESIPKPAVTNADFFVAPNGQTYVGDGKMSCDEAIGRALGLSDAYDSKSTDQESIGSEVVAVEDVDSDGWVDAKDNSELVEAFGSASLTDSLPTAPIDGEEISANQLNVDGTFATLLSMGYSDQQARRAISHCGCDLENCIDYISQQ